VQALATQGFSVLQINYRGSSGFGDSFLRAGNLHWGDLIQQDIISGTRWAIENGKANSGNICIMGANFGAYSAVQSAILEPDLFACAVANAGIYDLELLYKRGDIEDLYWGDAYLEEVIGRDEEQLRKFSPVHNIAALKIPVFIAHGKQDERAPYEHAKRLKKSLDEHNKQYEWFVKGDESQTIYDTENQVAYITAALKFLNQHLELSP
jgi:dipeptidyl aminopeptidase/acylaminoacyl peptidase